LHKQPRRIRIAKSIPIPESAGGQEKSNKWGTTSTWKEPTPSDTPTPKAKTQKIEGYKKQ